MKRMTMPLAILAGLALSAAETIQLAPPGHRLPYGESASFAFYVPAGVRSARLTCSARLNLARCAGSTHAMVLRVNGNLLTAGLDRTALRLTNKPPSVRMASGLEVPWYDSRGWRVVYAPDFEMAASPAAGGMRIEAVSPHRLVLDLSDLLRPDAENTLQIEHRGAAMRLREAIGKDAGDLDLLFAELSVDLSEEPSAMASRRRERRHDPDALMDATPAALDPRQVVEASPEGALRLRLPGLALRVESAYARVGGGWNPIPAAAGGDPAWSPRPPEGAADAGALQAASPGYRLQRQVTWAADHLVIADTLTNTGDADIGLAFDHSIVPENPADLVDVYLGGDPSPARTRLEGHENPSVFVNGTQAGCALVALDDVYRIQGVMHWEQGRAGIRSETFALAAGASYTLRWALYPVGSPDYFDAVNLLRRDLTANHTVPGGFRFGLNQIAKLSDEALQAMVRDLGIRFIASPVWFAPPGDPQRCYHGHHMLQAKAVQDALREACAKVRRVCPEVKTLIYIHAFINTDPAGPERFADARIINQDGTHYCNPSYTQRIGVPFYYYVPTLENSYFKALMEVVDMCLDPDQIGADGIYWDELDMASVSRTFDRWDGHSAVLDEQHRIVRRFANTHLLSLPAKTALIEAIAKRGGALIANSAPTTATLNAMSFPRFVETAQEWYPARAHMHTPISLGNHLAIKTFDDLVADIRLKLNWGSLYYYYSVPEHPYPTITQHMFPFTPVALKEGWMIGRERILTAVPGTFTFGDDDPVRVYWYDASGRLTERVGSERLVDGVRQTRLPLADGEMAVIERLTKP
ncbi:MAG: hypothetical protein GX595_01480 [Lentisphaerae bacterium]|nr:hypothetical protein [Lentisphaerota bacterium]